jgi:hypothetical protein
VSGVREEKQKKLKPETSVFVIWNFYSSGAPEQPAILTGNAATCS